MWTSSLVYSFRQPICEKYLASLKLYANHSIDAYEYALLPVDPILSYVKASLEETTAIDRSRIYTFLRSIPKNLILCPLPDAFTATIEIGNLNVPPVYLMCIDVLKNFLYGLPKIILNF
ncbi:hypothetical protein AVEN_152881-1 [Araneus ventricosus]|uniref:Uncharacterized protein n=1 Tax=Araneus ventricosus TaxID=182803 RepID=A0A4Y2ACR2_ARAVE|nr:hypothetical protein AVEN_152881-1 [Araneus ventricosus]